MDFLGPIQLSNLSKHCRTCLKVCQNEMYNVATMPVPIFRLFKQNVSYKKSQKDFPNKICSTCFELLKNFDDFRVTALRCTRLLEQALKSTPKKLETDSIETEILLIEDIKVEKQEDVVAKRRSSESSEQSKNELQSVSQNLEEEAVRKNEDNVVDWQSDQYQDFEGIFIKTDGESEDIVYNEENLELVEGTTAISKTKKSLKAERKTDKEHLYNCSHCDRGYRYPTRLSKHLIKVHNIKPTLTVCEHKDCRKKFQHNETAIQHNRIVHERPVKNKPKPKDASCICEDCGRIYKNVHKLREHRYQHEPIESRPFHCDQCNKGFTSKRFLKEHLLRHSGIKAFECPHCNMKKTSARELRTHINIHTKEKQYPCESCPRVFLRLANLKIHDRVVHKRMRQFNCRYCDQSFGKPDTLKYHEMRHTGERPYKCKICEKSFIQPTAFKTHQKIHSKPKKTISDK